ncbi:A/G-specific adenine glycosylase [Lewinella aquimaris]|uniref:Adenine DNA glycosylase n=1 Tax=Neolewinella aquimaris TaxID=1835722 RepID=A0A840E7C5_9BACT|nr:A/G-specific adenine glycosylase [Neolewinella aquimaris]MBB4079525.1 A/G-specific adenine glycosylase [Neolewinella aquimaris]
MRDIDWQLFRDGLLSWYRPERRPMPWKQEPDPYKIWLSEIILQQTRVEQGLPYFERFVAAYPTVHDLANAPDDEVMKLWEGLGYYSRARNLLRAARQVSGELGGAFPDTYEGLLGLAGVGPYTAAAIASFAFGRQVAVLDGNVYRVLSRFAADATPIDGGKGRKHFQTLTDAAMGAAPAATFNQAIMDFGALMCTPKLASCAQCPVAAGCRARRQDKVYQLPVKGKKASRRERFFHYLVVSDSQGRYLLHRRGAGDVWQDLYQFPLIETQSADLGPDQLFPSEQWPQWLATDKLAAVRRSKVFRHQLSHQQISVVFHVFTHSSAVGEPPSPYELVAKQGFSAFAFPRVITRFLEDASPTLGF